MNRTTTRNAILIVALLGVMVAGQAMAAGSCRYIGSGDYNDLYSVTGTNGWGFGCTCAGGLPCTNDAIRIGWATNTVTLTNAVTVARFQIGVDESGRLVVASGGGLTACGTSPNTVGNNGGGVTGRLTVHTNGVVNSSFVLEVGASATGILTIDGGTVNLSHHLWVGSTATGVGSIILTNGGTLNLLAPAPSLNGMIGLGTINAISPSGGTGTVKVNGGGVLNLYNIEPSGSSIQPGSVLDISGSGIVTIPNDRTAIMSDYVYWGKITAYSGTGTVAIDYNTSTPGKTTLKAVGGYVPPTECVWTQTNTSSPGFWSDGTNWTCGLRPAGITPVIFNVPGAIPCVVNDLAMADSILMGTNGPGGTLIITNTGILSCVGTNATFIGYNSNALMVVENGASVTFAAQLRIGFDSRSDGKLLMNGGAVSVSGMFDLGYLGGKGTAQIKGGTLNLSQFDDYASIQGASVLDVTGTGKVVLNGDHSLTMNSYISTGQLTNSSGAGVLVDFGIINPGKTTVYPVGLDLRPAQDTWNPAANPSGTGMWEECANWQIGGMCPGILTHVRFNVPDAIPCTVTSTVAARYIEMGNSSGPGGTLIVTNGGSLTTGTDNWSAVAYASNALMVVVNASASFGYHLWVGFGLGADGTLIVDGSTVSVGGMFGLGWNGGKGTCIVTNGGRLNLAQLHPTDSIKGNSVLNLADTGMVLITGNFVSAISNYVRGGKIIANGGAGTVAYGFDSGANKTIVQVAPPRQSVMRATVSGGNTTLSYQTTAGHFYHLESTPSLTPANWVRVTGSTTNAAGASVTFTFPTSGDQRFYRTASP